MQELDLYLDPDEFFCPVTGQQIMGIEKDLSPSPAMLFFYLHEVQEFEYVHQSIKESFPQHFSPGGEIQDPEELYNTILEENYMHVNERILINFGQLSMASMGFDFNLHNQGLNNKLTTV